jgi:Fe-S oxidoreductase
VSTVTKKFDYAGYYRRIREIEKLAVPADDITWIEKYTRPTEPVDVLLYLGCNVLMTAHLAREVVNVFDALGVSFAAVGGPQFCCGIVHHGEGDTVAATRLSGATVGKFESFGAKQIVMWCPSCNRHFDEVVLRQMEISSSITHATAYLAEHVDVLAFKHRVECRAALHTHTDGEQSEHDAAAATTLLSSIPGVEIVDTVSAPELGYHCTDAVVGRYGRDGFGQLRSELAEGALARGADTVVTLYHSCHRQWSGLTVPDLAVRNYISLVAESLGVSERDHYQEFVKSGDNEQVVEASRAMWKSHGLSEWQARELVEKHFNSSSPE